MFTLLDNIQSKLNETRQSKARLHESIKLYLLGFKYSEILNTLNSVEMSISLRTLRRILKCMGFATYAFLCYCGSTALPYKDKASSSGSVFSFLLCITGSSRACQRAVAWTSCPTPQHEELSREPLWGSTAQQGEDTFQRMTSRSRSNV